MKLLSMLKTVKILVLQWIIIFSLSQAVCATTWYVDKTATGLNNGASWADAWKTFASIRWSLIQPGDTIYISGGGASKTFTESLTVGKSGNDANPITIAVD